MRLPTVRFTMKKSPRSFLYIPNTEINCDGLVTICNRDQRLYIYNITHNSQESRCVCEREREKCIDCKGTYRYILRDFTKIKKKRDGADIETRRYSARHCIIDITR